MAKDDPDAVIAAEICLNLFREGYNTLPDLLQAMGRHKALADIAEANDLPEARKRASC